MKVKTDFYYDRLYWDAVDEILNSNEPHSYDLLCENYGSMIVINPIISSPLVVYIQIGTYTLEYQIK